MGASATLEEVAIRWGALLSEDGLVETRYKNLLKGMDQNLTFLAELVKERVSKANQPSVLDMIDRAWKLKNKRNEDIHGVWSEMIDAETGRFVGVARSRYEMQKAMRSTWWDLSVPTIAELQTLASDLNGVAHEINERMADLWDIDEDVRRWRDNHGY
jgi:hypothetical protein